MICVALVSPASVRSLLGGEELRDEDAVCEEVAVGEEIPSDVAPGVAGQAIRLERIAQQALDRGAEALEVARIVDEEARLAVDHLPADPPDRARDARPTLPHRLGHREPEPLREALLDDDRRVPLERVDHER